MKRGRDFTTKELADATRLIVKLAQVGRPTRLASSREVKEWTKLY